MQRLILFFSIVLLAIFSQCKKEDPIVTPTVPETFQLTLHNSFNELQAKYAVFLSDDEGNLKAFRWIPSEDTAQINLLNVKKDQRFDVTVVKIVTLDAAGSGVRDTAISLTTYTQLASGENIYLQPNNYKILTDFRVQFTNINSFDSIIISDGLTFSRPQVANGFYGQYRISHTGRFWGRVKINGEEKWRYMRFDNINQSDVTATIDPTILPTIFSSPKKIHLPFVAPWKYTVDGIENLEEKKFFPLGDLNRAPGGAIAVYNELSVYEPIVNDIFNPEPLPYSSFRVKFSGDAAAPDGYVYESDRIYTVLPDAPETPTFDAIPSALSNNRYSNVLCSGNFDVLTITRSFAGSPSITWDAQLAAGVGNLGYRLPDLPKELSDLFFPLKLYQFGNAVRAKAESYTGLEGYDAVVKKRLANNDPLWQAKAGYLAKGR
jgi:hypothetical protein